MGKLNIVSTSFDPGTRYTLWSGLAGGLFLSLSYLGTDQSQVQRYLGAEDERSSKFGLLFNATFKVPMQFAILAIGVLLLFFTNSSNLLCSLTKARLTALRSRFSSNFSR